MVEIMVKNTWCFALLSIVGVSCSPSSPTSSPNTPAASTTSFHISIFNACNRNVQIRVGNSETEGDTIVLMKQMRDTIQGTTQHLWLLDAQNQSLASYQPVQGRQHVQVTADCTGLVRDYH